jgi:hypothetical protein
MKKLLISRGIIKNKKKGKKIKKKKKNKKQQDLSSKFKLKKERVSPTLLTIYLK